MALPNGTSQLSDRLANTVQDLVPDIPSLIEAAANRIRDELLHPQSVGPVATKLFRTWHGILDNTTVSFNANLPLMPDFWVVRIESNSATAIVYTITQSGGDEIGGITNVNRLQRYVIPGTYNELTVQNDGGANNLFYIISAFIGYPMDMM